MSERLEFKGDYMGFTYNGKHSSEFGIVRVSDGSRFNENLLPTIQDKTVQVPGGDGTYYFGSFYTQRQFSISFAFNDLTEQELANLRTHFGDKGVHDLIFDECPYKAYSAKVTGTATIKYIPFDQGEKHRIYKGEGSIQFTCYYPFARCWSINKDDYYTCPAYRIKKENSSGYKNKSEMTEDEKAKILSRINEWWDAAKIEVGINYGDVEAPFILSIIGTGSIQTNNGIITWTDITELATLNTRTGVVLDKNKKVISNKATGNLTMKIPIGAVDSTSTKFSSSTNQVVISPSPSSSNNIKLTYDRYYI